MYDVRAELDLAEHGENGACANPGGAPGLRAQARFRQSRRRHLRWDRQIDPPMLRRKPHIYDAALTTRTATVRLHASPVRTRSCAE